MRSNTIKNNYSHLEKAIETIEKCVQKKMSPIEISRRLEAESMLNYKYFNAVFSYTTGYTLAKYIRRRALTVVFEKWKNDRRKVYENSMYERYERFPKRFFKEFNISIEDAAKKNYTEKQLQEKIDIFYLVHYLEALDEIQKSKLVKTYTFKNTGQTELPFINRRLLLFYLQMPVYILRYCDYKPYETLEYEAKVSVIAALNKWYQAECNIDKVIVTEKEFFTICKRIYYYEFCRIDGLLIVKPKRIGNLKRIFCNMCDDLLPYIYLALPECLIPQISASELYLIDNSGNMDLLSVALKKSQEETRDLLWKYLERGYLRVMI